MSFGRRTDGEAGGKDVETVDLTSSSPEPEPKPEPQRQPSSIPNRHAGQQRFPTYLKNEKNLSHIRANGIPSPGSSRSRVPANISHPLPSVSADHLRQIINTTPPQKVADVLLELCKSSPALSGAVARGLAPHSAWAKNTIRDYQIRTGVPQVKSEPGKASSSSSSSAFTRPSPVKRDYQSPRPPQPKTPVKYEIDTLDPETDDSLSDLEALLEQPSRSSGLSGSAVAGPSSSSHGAATSQTPTQPSLSVRIKPEPANTVPYCMQCEKTIQEGTPCRYHLGTLTNVTKGNPKIRIWSCCNKPPDGIGCCAGDHIPTRDPATGTKKPRLV